MIRYFAYGSNLSPREMETVTRHARFYALARLPDHALDFTRMSQRRGGGVADIVPRRGSDVWGVVYELPESALPDLDRKEGAPSAYRRTDVQVEMEPGIVEEVLTYVVASREGPFTPSEDYKRLLVEGARHWGLPESYQQFLESIATHTEPIGGRELRVEATRDRRASQGEYVVRLSRDAARDILGSRDRHVAVVHEGKAALCKLVRVRNDALPLDVCELDQTVRGIIGIGRDPEGTRVTLFRVRGRLTGFPGVAPRHLLLESSSPLREEAEKNIVLLAEQNLRLIGVQEGEYVKLTALVEQEDGYRVRSIVRRAFVPRLREHLEPEEPRKIARSVYLDADARDALGLSGGVYERPVLISPAVWSLFSSRMIFYGVSAFLGFAALNAITSVVYEGNDWLTVLVAVVLALVFTSVFAWLDLRGKLRY